QIDYLYSLGRDGAVRALVDYQPIAASGDRPTILPLELPERAEMRSMSDDERQKVQAERRQRDMAQLQRVRRWWVERMVTTPRPLEEKMVLFWHGHFTSGAREVQSSRLLWKQNELFRKNAVGNYRTLLLEISKDPAMLRYLNNAQNVARHPNENY